MAVDQLVTQGNKLYALSSYDEAIDKYGSALEEFDSLNGEEPTTITKPDLMFLYGRSLFKLALQKTQVLGTTTDTDLDEGRQTQISNSKPLLAANSNFSFEGDIAADDGDQAFEDEVQDETEQVVEDDMQIAWETLDLARLNYEAGLATAKDSEQTAIKQRLADTLDVLGEISLENENFDQAVADLRTALTLKKDLYDKYSTQISSAHYMLALALEYCTATASRSEAAVEVQAAIRCFEGRLASQRDSTTKASEEMGMVEELRLKLKELQAEPDCIKSADLAEIFGKEGTALKDSLVEAMQTSNDLTTLVRKRAKEKPTSTDVEQPSSKKSRIEQ